MVVVIVLAPLSILLVLDPQVLMFGYITQLVHQTELSMDQALTTLMEGMLLGIFGPGALREIWAIVADRGQNGADNGVEEEGE